jgi:hypothetical protein
VRTFGQWDCITLSLASDMQTIYLDAKKALHACRPPTTVTTPLVCLSPWLIYHSAVAQYVAVVTAARAFSRLSERRLGFRDQRRLRIAFVLSGFAALFAKRDDYRQ